MDRSDAQAANHRVGWRRHACWLISALVLVAFLGVLTASSVVVAVTFPDVSPALTFSPAIDDLASRGIIAGFPDGGFHPDSQMTRQQFAKVLSLALALPVTEADVCAFADVTKGGPDTLYPDNYIAALVSRGIVTGTKGGNFSPGSPVTLGQAETMLERSARLLDPTKSPDVIPQLPGPSVDPTTPLTRGQVVYLLSEFLTHVVDPAHNKPGPGEISGVVRQAVASGLGRPVAGATVTVRATAMQTISDDWGRYTLRGLKPTDRVVVTAWAAGYYVGASEPTSPGSGGVDILIRSLPTIDDPTYQWLSAFGTGLGSSNCESCHSAAVGASEQTTATPLPFDEWVADAHSGSAHNIRFLTMYTGTDVNGNKSPLTRHVWDKDYGLRPLPPDPNLPYYGPGYKLDFTQTAGNCATCHVPVAAIDDPYGVDPTAVKGVASEGVGCDFCHKISAVKVDTASGLPHENAPGVLSLEMLRPSLGQQFFAGPYKDVAPGNDTYSPLQKQSLLCASCHTASFWRTKVYDSYGEWLASPYSDPVTGKTCQDCHMPNAGATLVARTDVGGNERDPATVRSHLMPGATDVGLLQSALTLNVTAEKSAGRLNVVATVANDTTGHHVPTDSPLRQVLLVVQANGPAGQPLQRVEGPVLPEWAGVGGDPAEGRYAGLPGKAFAKILREPWTGIEPSAAYWNPTVIVSDTRLAALASDTTNYVFAAPTAGPVSVRVTLLYRRAFLELAEQKGWNLTDIVMQERQIALASP